MGAHGILPRQLFQLRGPSVVPAQDAVHIERRIPMNLTDTQTQPVVLSTAAKREDGGVERRKHRNPTDFVVKQPGRVQPVKKSKDKKLQRSYKSRGAVSKAGTVEGSSAKVEVFRWISPLRRGPSTAARSP